MDGWIDGWLDRVVVVGLTYNFNQKLTLLSMAENVQ